MIDQLMARASLLLTKSEIFLQTFSIPLHTRYFLLDKNGSKIYSYKSSWFQIAANHSMEKFNLFEPHEVLLKAWKLANLLTSSLKPH